ncbi:MAG: hypothetical protein DRR16_09770 [Candidatus Parabeggiatoa sp. nov. 3]|nr:MAG: hypothetical protein DRR00_15350 [Gammaproteobacteria bacterium]RKZ86410.1 MAG: hypothetical protein DRR16_09770 [Gammaproteobacteria bacterium]
MSIKAQTSDRSDAQSTLFRYLVGNKKTLPAPYNSRREINFVQVFGEQPKPKTHHFTFHAKVARNFSVKYSFCLPQLLREIQFPN